MADTSRPNVIVVLFDDVGYSDFGCFGSEIATPTIDRLAAGGLRYTNFHTTALCSPTRAALLTGRNHHAVGMGRLASFDLGEPGYRGEVDPGVPMLSQLLRPAGYASYAVGKWHLVADAHCSAAGPFDQWPAGRRFDRYYGFLGAATNQWHPELVRDTTLIDAPDEPGYHLTADLVDQSIDMLSDHTANRQGDPFFLYLALGANHAPHHVPRKYVDKYVDAFSCGWDEIRAARLERQIAAGILPIGTTLPPRNDGVAAWDDLDADHQRLATRLQAAYAGMLDHADEQLGRLVAHLERTGQLANTLIMVLSDNGASDEGGPDGSINHRAFVHGVALPFAEQLARIDEVGSSALMNHYPAGWGMASNTPLRRYKWTAHGGGIRDPLVVHWPVGILKPGLRHQFQHVTDLFPTVLDVTGAANHTIAQDGVSLAYTFADIDAVSRHRTQYFEVAACRGIWHDGWKAVAFHRAGTDIATDDWELYDIVGDPAESIDLAGAEPARLKSMRARFDAEAERNLVRPITERGQGAQRQPDERPARFDLPDGTRHVPSGAAPDIRNRSYRIRAEIDLDPTVHEGVLIAHGGPASGYTLYVAAGHLVHDYNYFGRHNVVRSDRPIPAGTTRLGYCFVRTGPHQGVGTLLIDDGPSGQQSLERTLPVLPQWESLSVGSDEGAPVGDYPGPFRFSGRLSRVVVEVDSSHEPDHAATAEAAAHEQ